MIVFKFSGCQFFKAILQLVKVLPRPPQFNTIQIHSSERQYFQLKEVTFLNSIQYTFQQMLRFLTLLYICTTTYVLAKQPEITTTTHYINAEGLKVSCSGDPYCEAQPFIECCPQGPDAELKLDGVEEHDHGQSLRQN